MKKTYLYIFTILLLFTLVGCYNTQRLKPGELKSSKESSNGKYTVKLYRNNGGSLSHDAMLGVLTNNETKENKNIYWMYKEYDFDIEWVDDVTVKINGMELNVERDVYDWRKDDEWEEKYNKEY
ncbi:DUF5412 family protein [Miniphocaeibacter massiliensis]|uniref:DUF5412 family protein n=1 Tax=Miniphocaeibacter massiliensis TaxID=2041841 RepID=UPI000C1B91AA|nr:DUF5412 family protein [Miniphocaeibacter massiliensis]